jgi:uncharacterized protein YggE
MRRYGWILGLAGALAAVTPAPAAALAAVARAPAAADTTTTQTLSVLGSGTVFVTPDVADVSVSVTRTGSTSSRALSAANGATDAIVRSVRAVGISSGDIQTQSVSVYSFVRRVGPHKRKVRRWSANESLGVHVTDIRLVGKAIDAAVHAGASNVGGPSYSFSDPSAGVVSATDAAIADAKRRADNAAAAIGYTVTGVQSIDLNPGSGFVTSAASGAAPPPVHAGAPSTPTNVHPGKVEVDAQVEIVYTIAPA